MQVAQLRLRHAPVIIVAVGRARVIVMLVRREMVSKVPDRVRQRAVLRSQQQKRAQEVQR
jgi:hypothetical protein